MKGMKGIIGLGILTGVILALFSVSAWADYSYTTLDYPSAHSTTAFGISGSNIVGTYDDGSMHHHGFIYNGSTWSTIDYPGSSSTTACGINNNNIVGTYSETHDNISWHDHGFLYNGSTWTTLDYPGATVTVAFGINGSNIVGYYNDGAGTHGFLYNGSTWTTLDYPGATYTEARGIDGSNIVGYYNDGAGYHGFLYNGSTWTTLDYPGAMHTDAFGISGSNIVGIYPGNGRYLGFLYNGSTWTTLDYPGALWYWVQGISGSNIVGYYSDGSGTHGFLATASAIQLPKTGQTTCYDSLGNVIPCAGTGQDGEIQAGVAWPSPRFTDNGGGTVTDNLTGLIWTQDAGTPTVGACAGGAMKWQDGLNYIACLNTNNYLGHNDWRLSNINELLTVINYGEINDTWLTSEGFTNVQSNCVAYGGDAGKYEGCYWTSTSYAGDNSGAWFVSMRWLVSVTSKSISNNYIWPVRSAQFQGSVSIPETGQTVSYALGDDGDIKAGVTWPNPRFIDTWNGSIIDNLTGLMWPKNASTPSFSNCYGGKKLWQDALYYVACLNTNHYLGYNDWRLPNIKELMSLINRGAANSITWLTSQGFTNVVSDLYWSSTTQLPLQYYAWTINTTQGYMYDGFLGEYIKSSNPWYVWPVRSSNISDVIVDSTPPTTAASPPSGTYSSAQNVTLTCNDGGGSGCQTTYYCTGTGCNPTTVYTGAISIASSTVLRFYSKDNADNSEAIKTETYTISIPDTTPPTTTASPAGGTFASAQTVTLTCNDGGGSGCQTTRYCLGSGCTPSTIYSGAINISSSNTLRF